METDIIPTPTRAQLDRIVSLVTDGLDSPNSKVMYKKALDDFLSWYQDQGNPGLIKATIQAYKVHLQGLDYAPATINQKLTAVRRLVAEAVDNQLIDPLVLVGVQRVKGVKISGERLGNWLTLKEAQKLLETPDITSLKGLRDRAVLAVMLGGGLRRSEVAGLHFSHIQQRDGRWVVSDLTGKGGRVRSVPIPAWAKQAIDEWTTSANISDGSIFRSVNKGERVGNSITSQAIQDLVKEHAKQAGFTLSAHDLRRTFAHLARKGGAELEQIQLTLGHASIKTTERYLGIKQNISCAPCDVIRLHLE